MQCAQRCALCTWRVARAGAKMFGSGFTLFPGPFYAPDYLPPSASALVKPQLSTGDNQGSRSVLHGTSTSTLDSCTLVVVRAAGAPPLFAEFVDWLADYRAHTAHRTRLTVTPCTTTAALCKPKSVQNGPWPNGRGYHILPRSTSGTHTTGLRSQGCRAGCRHIVCPAPHQHAPAYWPPRNCIVQAS